MFRVFALLIIALFLGACAKEPVKLVSAKIVSLDNGSGNFDRMLEMCFDKPLTSDYYHKIQIVSKQSYKIEGGSTLRPMHSDPDALCRHRNLYNYVSRQSPPGSRGIIKNYMVEDNIHQLLVQVYYDKPEGNSLPLDEALFSNL
jgi:hypothetical protein